jgi:isoquinoline 1-oxidoreductase subunit alpha
MMEKSRQGTCTVPITLSVNGKSHELNADPASPLLWVLRDHLKLTGTKFGCGVGQCSACTVLVDGVASWSCQITAGDSVGTKITTIEGLAQDEALTAVQQAWIDLDVAQCGYCQAGQILTATELLRKNRKPTDADIDDAMTRNLCRCGTYTRIRAAIHAAAAKAAKGERV